MTTSTHDSRIRTALPIPYECRGLDRKRARTHEQVTSGARGVGDRVCSSFADGTTGCNHQVGARVGPRVTQFGRSRGVFPQIPHTKHSRTRCMAEVPPILMHTSVAHPSYKLLVDMESPGRVEVTTSTHDSRIRTALSLPRTSAGVSTESEPVRTNK